MKSTIKIFLAAITIIGAAAHAGHHEMTHGSTGAEGLGSLPMEEKIALAKAAAPSNVSDNARILDSDNSVLQEGGNGWTCMVGSPPNYENPMCVDATWLGWLDAWMNKKPYKNTANMIGVNYMLVGDIPVDNDDPYNTDESKGTWVQEGPHLMLLVPQELFGSLPRNPYEGGPYVMWEGTDYAHIMVPLEKTTPIVYDE
jgi:hypothetical protein